MTARAISRSTKIGLCCLVVSVLAGSAALLAQPPAPDPTPTPAPDDLLASLRAADADYHRFAEARDRIRFQSLLTRDAVFLAGEVHRGFGRYLHAWDPLWNATNDFSYRGHGTEAKVAESGELGVTLGHAETRFRSPLDVADSVISGSYLTVWRRSGSQWQVAASGPLVVHATLGEARETRSGLMTAWPELAGRIGDEIEIHWRPESTVKAQSGELAYVLGTYDARFGASAAAPDAKPSDRADGGSGHFLTVWQRDDELRWQLAGEALTPPDLSGPN